MSEADLLRAVLQLCAKHNVLVFHDRDSRRNASGLPDLVLVGQNDAAFAELKTEHGQLRSDQTRWRYRLLAAGQTYYLWRPSDLASGEIETTLATL